MIQFKRGKTNSWTSDKKPLADGQPGYDRTKKKIKIGDGKHSWQELPYASGLFRDEIISSEEDAKKTFDPILTALGIDERPIITYGPKSPDKNTIGQLYLQYYDAEPEVDYVVSFGVDGMWTYQKWHSGIARCWGTFSSTTAIQDAFESIALYSNTTSIKAVQYPFEFTEQPSETASLCSPGGIVWLATSKQNTKSKSATYTILSPDKQITSAKYDITLMVEGRWRANKIGKDK
jgi:hypothetical protein